MLLALPLALQYIFMHKQDKCKYMLTPKTCEMERMWVLGLNESPCLATTATNNCVKASFQFKILCSFPSCCICADTGLSACCLGIANFSDFVFSSYLILGGIPCSL